MSIHAVRYMFEHRVLPHLFFESKTQFVSYILNDKKAVYNIIDDMFEKECIDNPYNFEQFTTQAFKITEDILVLKIMFPEPEDEPLCYCSYLLFDMDFEKVSYFCIEKGNESGNYAPFLCSWRLDGRHINYGNCDISEDKDLIQCVKIHTKEYYGCGLE